MSDKREFELVSSTSAPMTKELAEKFRDMKPSPTERELDPKRVAHLRKKAEQNRLVTFHWAVANIDGEDYRMNGQHSSVMLAELNGDFPDDLYAHVDVYKVSKEIGLPLLFRQFDDRKSSRGPADIAGAYQGLYRELDAVPRKVGAMAIKGIAWHQFTVEGMKDVPKGDDVWTMFDRAKDYTFMHWLGELFSEKTPELKRPEIVAAMYSGWISNEIHTKGFWGLVARGGDHEADHPATRLDEWLIAAKQITDAAKKFRAANYYQACITCYNAFVEDRTITRVNCKTDKGFAQPTE